MRQYYRKILAVILLVAIVTVLSPHPAKADLWGESIYAAMDLKQMMEEMYNKIQQTIIATLKTAGIKMLMTQLNKMMGSGQAGVGPIGDWRQFIYGTANQYAMQVTNDFFRSMQSGIPSALSQRIITPAQSAVMINPYSLRPDLQSYVREGRADMIFQPGYAQNPWVAWNQAAKPQNDLAYMYMMASDVQQNAYNQQTGAKTAEGIANQGFQSKRTGGTPGSPDSGTITATGSEQKDLQAKVQNMPMDRLSMAQTIPDVVVSMVTAVMTQMLNRGISMAASAVNKQTGGALSPAIGTFSSGAASIGNTVIRGGSSSINSAIQQGLK